MPARAAESFSSATAAINVASTSGDRARAAAPVVVGCRWGAASRRPFAAQIAAQLGEEPPIDRYHPLLAALAGHPDPPQPHVHIGQQKRADLTGAQPTEQHRQRDRPIPGSSKVSDERRNLRRKVTPAAAEEPAPGARHLVAVPGRDAPAGRGAPAPRSTGAPPAPGCRRAHRPTPRTHTTHARPRSAGSSSPAPPRDTPAAAPPSARDQPTGRTRTALPVEENRTPRSASAPPPTAPAPRKTYRRSTGS